MAPALVVALASEMNPPKHVDFFLHVPRPTQEVAAIVQTSARSFSTATWTNGKSLEDPPPQLA